MDPKQLDPKLKEAYERVMGINVTPKAPGQGPQGPTPPANPIQGPNPQPPQAKPIIPGSMPPPSPLNTGAPTGPTAPSGFAVTGGVKPAPPPKPGTGPAGKFKKPISPVVLAIALVVFFLGYTVAWIKIFNVSVPFFAQGTNNKTSGANKITPPTAVSPTIIQPTLAPTDTPAPTEIPTEIPTIEPTVIPTTAPPSSGSATTIAPTVAVSTASSH